MSLAVTSKVNMAGLITARWKARSTFQLCRTKQPFGLRGRYDGKTVRSKTSAVAQTSTICIRMHSAFRCYWRSEEHTSELQSLMRISYAVFCLQKITPRINAPSCQYHPDLKRIPRKQTY